MSRKIRNKIDQAIGRQNLFTDQDTKAIYEKIEQAQPHHIKVKHRYPAVLAYASVAVLLFIFVSIGLQERYPAPSHPVQQNHVRSVSADQHALGQSQHRSKIRTDKSFRTYVDESLGKEYPDKYQIVKKMYFSLDYIHNAQGEFVWGDPVHGDTSSVEFYVDFVKKRGRSKNQDLKNGKVIQTTNSLFKSGMFTNELLKKHIFSKGHVQNNRSLPPAGSLVTQSEWFVRIANDYSQWHYKVGKKFGMPVYEITGIDNLKRPFTMTVSKDTGALLDLRSYDKKNKKKLSFFITVKNIKINQGIPADVFKLDVSGDQEVSEKKFFSSILEGQAFKGEKICGENCKETHPQ